MVMKAFIYIKAKSINFICNPAEYLWALSRGLVPCKNSKSCICSYYDIWEVFFIDDTFNKQLQNKLWAIYWQISDIGLHCHVSQAHDSVYIYTYGSFYIYIYMDEEEGLEIISKYYIFGPPFTSFFPLKISCSCIRLKRAKCVLFFFFFSICFRYKFSS